MSSINYSVCSETFKSNISKGFSLLQHQQEFVDVTLATDGHLVKAHQNVLALASPYLKGILKSASCQHPIIFLCNIGHNILSYLLEYIYNGEVQVPSKIYPSFLNAAKQMHILGLEDLNALMDMETLITKENVPKRQGQNKPNSLDVLADVVIEDERFTSTESVAMSDNAENDNIIADNAFIHEHNMSIGSDDSEAKYDLSNLSQNTTIIKIEEPANQLADATTVPIEILENHVAAFKIEGNIKETINEQDNVSVSEAEFLQPCTNSYTVELHDQNIVAENSVTAPLYTMSSRGSLKMILNRFLYNMHHISEKGHKRRWRCVDYRRKHCLAYVDTQDEIITSRRNIHTHGFHDKKIMGTKKTIFTSIKQVACLNKK